MIYRIRKRAGQLMQVMKLFFITSWIWKENEWAHFWFTNSTQQITLNSLDFQVRSSGLREKISDLAMVFEVVYNNAYGSCRIDPADIIIDIGAHIGGFSVLASGLAPRGKVYSYEPSPSAYELLRKNLNLNQRKNVKTFKVAVSDRAGTADLYVNRLNLAENSLYQKGEHKYPVQLITLDKIFKDNALNRCDVLKLDCEGAEYSILFSSERLLKKIDRIILEYHEPTHFNLPKQYGPNELAGYLKKNGFDIKIKKQNYYQGIIYAERARPK